MLKMDPPRLVQDLEFSGFFGVAKLLKSWKSDDFLCMNVLSLGVFLFLLQSINSDVLKVPEVKHLTIKSDRDMFFLLVNVLRLKGFTIFQNTKKLAKTT